MWIIEKIAANGLTPLPPFNFFSYYFVMEIGQKLVVKSNWSVTGEKEEVTLVSLDKQGLVVYVRYSTGYAEWLPISVLI